MRSEATAGRLQLSVLQLGHVLSSAVLCCAHSETEGQGPRQHTPALPEVPVLHVSDFVVT